MSRRNQPNLFDDVAALPPPSAALVSLAQRIPPSIRFGTSTWTYDGWAGEVYHRSYRSAQPARWTDELDGFLRRLPRDFRYAVELRNAELLTDAHGAVLARHGVAHVFNSWNEMPAIGEQLELPWTFPAGFTVVRGLLRPGRAYADAVKLFEPYDRIRDPQPEVRHDLLRLIAEVVRRHMEALILVNNRLEGNAPGTIRAVVEMMEQGGKGAG